MDPQEAKSCVDELASVCGDEADAALQECSINHTSRARRVGRCASGEDCYRDHMDFMPGHG